MTTRLILACCLAAGCATDDASPTPPDQLPQTSGSYIGTYKVPTDPALAAAATFEVARIDWRVTGDGVHLGYDLPMGLVGGSVSVDMDGALGTTTASLSGDRGTASCGVTGTVVTCSEHLANLGALPLSTDVVEQQAALDYAGPAADRVQVAQVFSSDPIGSVAFDIALPTADDN